MSINPIELLKQKVTSGLLNDQDGLSNEKSNLLSKFYPILLSVLAAKPELIQKLKDSVSPSLSDLFGQNEQVKNGLLTHINTGQLSSIETEQTLNKAIPQSLTALSNEAGNDSQSIIQYLKQHADSIREHLPTWAVGLLAPLGIGGIPTANAHVSNLTNRTPVVTPPTKSRAIWPIIAIIVLGLLLAWLWRSCQNKQMDVPVNPVERETPQVAAVETTPATLSLSTDAKGAVSQCQIGVGDQGFLATVQAKVKEIFASTQDCALGTGSNYAATFTDQTGVAGVLALLKGVPNVSLDWVGDKITLKGGDAAQLNTLMGSIKTLVPNTEVTVEAPVTQEQSVTNSLTAAGDALSTIDANKVDINAVSSALNLQIINFATASHQIPDANKAILDKAATLLKSVKDAKLTVSGYTDSTGNANSNKALSQRRAQSVVDYLVSQGVDAAQLNAVGNGADNPVADNATNEGRFKNRRIEFSVNP
ncbi:MAG: OmpA family protein [Acinetobacter sp.]